MSTADNPTPATTAVSRLDIQFELDEAHRALVEIADLAANPNRDSARTVAIKAIAIAERAVAARMSRFMGADELPNWTRVGRITVPKPGFAFERGWVKHVTGLVKGERNGFKFAGPFLNFDEEAALPIGSIVLAKANPTEGDMRPQADLWAVTEAKPAHLLAIVGRRWWFAVADQLSGYLPEVPNPR